MAASVAAWKTKWLAPAKPFFVDLLKKGYPRTVVYPFGGGDLLSVLAVYPDATEYTTLSLEGMGDPRPLKALTSARTLAPALAKLKELFAMNLSWAWNTTIQLSIDSSDTKGGVPGILALTLVALDAHGYEPVAARYFTLTSDGKITYVTDADVAAWDASDAAQHDAGRKPTNSVQSGLFTNIELQFRAKGDVNAPVKTFRHIAANLSDEELTRSGAALAHLEAKGRIAAMTKAASYLLWKPNFGKLRSFLLHHMVVMVSDDTGIPPRYSSPEGFTLDVYGSYTGAHFSFASPEISKELVKLWKENPHRLLPFRFGYYDSRGHSGLLFEHK